MKEMTRKRKFDMSGPVPERDLILAHNHVHETIEREGGESSMERVMAILLAQYRGRDGKAARIYLRITAMIEAMKDPRIKAWSLGKTDDGAIMIDELLMRVAARLPLKDSGIGFDADEFYKEVLRRSKRGGQA
jgi:hypothetical protein